MTPADNWWADLHVPPATSAAPGQVAWERRDPRDVVAEHLALDALDAEDAARAYREVAYAALDELHAQRAELLRLRQAVVDLRDELRRYVALRVPLAAEAAQTMHDVEQVFHGKAEGWQRVQ